MIERPWREVANETTELCLHEILPQAGDCIFLPAGTVHAIGAGLLLAEIQQASDTTYRLYDWNRVGKDGKSRALHVEQALEVIDYARGPVHVQIPQRTSHPSCQQLVACDKFVLNRWEIAAPLTLETEDQFQLLAVVAGQVALSGDPAGQPLARGQTALIPAACRSLVIQPDGPATCLQMHLP